MKKNLSLYIHIPFCTKKCLYCSFVVAVGKDNHQESYVEALKKEALFYGREDIYTVYIGGGTPSLLTDQRMESLFLLLRQHFNIAPQAEITIEMNPEDVTVEKCKNYLEMGINRFSLGIQTFHEPSLKMLGRVHTVEKAKEAYDKVRQAGADNVSIDVMFCFPHQTKNHLQNDLTQATALNPDHISLYALTVEPMSRFFAQGVKLPEEGIQAEYYETVRCYLTSHGYEQYEISNFAKRDKASQHNMNYWQGGEYIGLGVGAHSFYKKRRFWNEDRLAKYLASVSNGKKPEAGSERLNDNQLARELVLFGLRMNSGVDVNEIQDRFQVSFGQPWLDKVDGFIKDQFLERNKSFVCTTDKGRLVLDELCSRLV